jgi:phage gp29-like protein
VLLPEGIGIVDFNFSGVTDYPKVWIRTEEEEDLKPRAERDKILIVDIGLPVGRKYLYDTYGIPEPEEGEELVKPNPQAAAGKETTEAKDETAEFAEGPLSDLKESQAAIDGLVDTSVSRADIPLSSIEQLVASAKDYPDLMRKLRDAYGTMDLSSFNELLERAVFTAELQGMTIA